MSPEETPREPRMMWIASSWPRVVIRPTFAPFLWMSAFVPTVVPWVSTAISLQNCSNESPSRSAATRIAASMPSAKLAGVEEDFVAVMRPSRPSATQSVKVPPMSTPTRNRATLVRFRWVEGGIVAYFHPCQRRGRLVAGHAHRRLHARRNDGRHRDLGHPCADGDALWPV